jgi:hypothetical protein
MSSRPIVCRWEKHFKDRNKEAVGDVKSVRTSTAKTDVNIKKVQELLEKGGPGKSSRYSNSLRAGQSGDQIPVGARFSAPVQTSPGAHPASYTMGTESFVGVKRPGSGTDHPPPIWR